MARRIARLRVMEATAGRAADRLSGRQTWGRPQRRQKRACPESGRSQRGQGRTPPLTGPTLGAAANPEREPRGAGGRLIAAIGIRFGVQPGGGGGGDHCPRGSATGAVICQATGGGGGGM